MVIKKLVGVCAAFVIGAASVASAKEIVVGGKGYTEQLLMAEMTAQLLGSRGAQVRKVDGMGSTVLRQAQETGQVDVYWEYTGTSLITFNKITDRLNAEETYQRVKAVDAEKGLIWLNPSKANNTYALAVRKDGSAPFESISDLAAAYREGQPLRMATNVEFPKREDGLIGLQRIYEFEVGRDNLIAMQGGLNYQALKEAQVEVALVFATDGRVGAFDFKVLADDKGFFPAYALTPVVRKDLLDGQPELAELLNELSARLDDAVMQRLNGMVDIDKRTVEEVAMAFLKEQQLL